MTDSHTCPICSGGVPTDERRGEYPGALSRFDNERCICSVCGQAEALLTPFFSTTYGLFMRKAQEARDWREWRRIVRIYRGLE